MPEPTPQQILALDPETSTSKPKKNYLGWIIFWLIGFTPVGCVLVWTKTDWPTPVKLSVTIAALALFLGLLLESELISTQLIGGLGLI